MPESDEHRFLTDTTLDVLRRMARSRLYGYREADRRTFDFACGLVRDWERSVAGQTLWKHVEGVDKDVRTMLADDEAEICLYVAQDTTRARNIFHEAIRDYRRSLSRARVWRLRVLWIPNDFDVDHEDDRASIVSILEEELTRDVLLNIVLGNISAEHVGHLVRSTGILGLDIALLAEIAFSGFLNISTTARALHVSPGPVRERIVRLLGCGFLDQPDPTGTFFHITVRGRVFLELCREISYSNSLPMPELERILQILELSPRTDTADPSCRTRYLALEERISAAAREWGVDLKRSDYFRYWEAPHWPQSIPRPAGPT